MLPLSGLLLNRLCPPRRWRSYKSFTRSGYSLFYIMKYYEVSQLHAHDC
jgi:hypothetical protein